MARWRGLRRGQLGLGERVDKAFVKMVFRERKGDRDRATDPNLAARLAELGAFYDEADAEGRLFPTPGSISPGERPLGHKNGAELLDLAWPSDYLPLHPEYAEALDRHPQTRVCRARWYRHPDPAPAIIVLHGWGGGQFPIESRIFPVRWLFGIGLDVLLMVLPFHGRRSGRKPGMPAFPSPSPPRSNEGFAQAIGDIRGLMGMLRARGAPSVGVMGMSLGGFTGSLLATVEPDLAYCMAMIPFASLPQLMWSQGEHRKVRRTAQAAGVGLAEFSRAFRATTPIERTAQIEPRRVFIAAGERDRITPPTHAGDLHAHFAGSTLITFPGSHLFQVGRGDVFRQMGAFMGGLGVLPAR